MTVGFTICDKMINQCMHAEEMRMLKEMCRVIRIDRLKMTERPQCDTKDRKNNDN